MAMNTAPKAQAAEHHVPPERHAEERVGARSRPRSAAAIPLPNRANTPNMMRQEPMPETIRIAAPIKQPRAEVSPIDPGTRPTKASHQVTQAFVVSALWPFTAASASQVAPLTPSTLVSAAVQTLSPEICRRIGKEQKRARGQRGVENVHPRAAEDLLANDHAEGNAKRPPATAEWSAAGSAGTACPSPANLR